MPPDTLTDISIKILVLYHSWPIQVTTIQPGWVRVVKRCSCCGSSLKKKNSKENSNLEFLTRDQGFLSPLYSCGLLYLTAILIPKILLSTKVKFTCTYFHVWRASASWTFLRIISWWCDYLFRDLYRGCEKIN